MVKALIFDFDGVLGDTFAMNIEVTRMIHPDITEQELRDFHNGNVHAGGFKLSFSEEQAQFFFDEMHRRFEEKHLFPFASDIRALAKKYTLFIVSSSTEKNLVKYLSCGGLLHPFAAVMGSETHTSKVVKFQKIFREYALTSEDCLFFTDTLGDIREADEVGLKTVTVTWGYQDETTLKKGNPAKIISQFEEVIPTIASFDSW